MTKKLTITFVERAIAILLLFFFLFLLSNCNPNSKLTERKEIEEMLRNTDDSIQNAIKHKNIDALISFYAEDATFLPTAEPKLEGKGAIKKEWQHIFSIPDFTSKSQLNKVEISNDGSMAYTMGSYMATMQGEDGKQVQEPGKWVNVWKKQSNGRWKIVVDTYNTDVPPPDHK